MTAEHEERAGQTLVTTNHETIMRWAEEREATPATVPGTEHDEYLGVLRFDFPGDGGDRLREVSWADWFDTFDNRDLEFLYQQRGGGGEESNFFTLRQRSRRPA